MVKYLLLLSVVFCTFGCSNRKLTRSETVTQYYHAFNSSDYNHIKTLITDSITIIEGDYVMPFSHETYYEQFKWDSIFQPTYRLVELENLDSQIIATISVNSLRFEFLKNNPLTCRHKISFKDGKIAKLETLECIDADWGIWQKERDSLVNWVHIHHPELDGFVHDLSMQGAINYLKAIELYKDNEETL